MTLEEMNGYERDLPRIVSGSPQPVKLPEGSEAMWQAPNGDWWRVVWVGYRPRSKDGTMIPMIRKPTAPEPA